MTDRIKKTKPELWRMLDKAEEKIFWLEQFLLENGMLEEATEYAIDRISEKEGLPFD